MRIKNFDRNTISSKFLFTSCTPISADAAQQNLGLSTELTGRFATVEKLKADVLSVSPSSEGRAYARNQSTLSTQLIMQIFEFYFSTDSLPQFP